MPESTVSYWLFFKGDSQIARTTERSEVARFMKRLTKLYPYERITVRFSEPASQPIAISVVRHGAPNCHTTTQD